jgi:acid phosphatase family membrane protein YuiD
VVANTKSVKTLFTVPTYAHYYKIIEMLKQFKIKTLALTCFGSHRNHHQGAVLCLSKTTARRYTVDAVNFIAAYQHVMHVCGELHACTTG